jgi:transcriptional regulator with GAF, ATPase, and Fis domain
LADAVGLAETTPDDDVGILGSSPAIQEVMAKIELAAPTDVSVLLLGETGTGKELVAREIHDRSARRKRSLVAVNCASVTRELFESEFFGHVRGAFTGAIRDRVGRFRLADGGTLFLDEVSEIPTDMQAKLLRVLQEQRFERVGDESPQTVDVRMVAATNRNLELEVAEGRFRSDLYFRLNVFPIAIPPLRERPEDIGTLAAHFLERAARQLDSPCPSLGEEELRSLRAYSWPGNVRELRNVMERAAITALGGRLAIELQIPGASPIVPAPPFAEGGVGGPARVLTEAEMRRFERENLCVALRTCDGKIYGTGGAAELLEMPPTTLVYRLRKLGLKPAKGRRGAPTGDDQLS